MYTYILYVCTEAKTTLLNFHDLFFLEDITRVLSAFTSLTCAEKTNRQQFLPCDAMLVQLQYVPWPCVCMSVCVCLCLSQVEVLQQEVKVIRQKPHRQPNASSFPEIVLLP